MKGSRIIGAYHTRRVAPLMRHTLPLHMMTPGASLDGTALVEGALSPSEVAQRVTEAMEPSRDDACAVLDFVYPVPGHPPMRPEPGVFLLCKLSFPALLFLLDFFDPLVLILGCLWISRGG